MAASQPPREPEGVAGDAFLDALLGLDSVCRYLAIVVGEAARFGEDPGDAPGDGPGEGNDALLDPLLDPLLDALLGLVSVHRTVSLLLAAAGTEAGDGLDAGAPAPDTAPAWSREVLR